KANEEASGLAATFDPAFYDPNVGTYIGNDPKNPNGIRQAARGDIPNSVTGNPHVLVMPRLNFAWDVSGTASTVVRGGAGLFYNRVQGNSLNDILHLPPNQFNSALGANDLPGGLTFANLRSVDPYSRLGAVNLTTLNPNDKHIPSVATMSLGV